MAVDAAAVAAADDDDDDDTDDEIVRITLNIYLSLLCGRHHFAYINT